MQVVIDSTCATVAEVRKRGDEFWGEFEFYLSDLLVGLVMDVVLVGLMAPTAVIGKARPVATGGAILLLPASMWNKFEASSISAVHSCFGEDLRSSRLCVSV